MTKTNFRVELFRRKLNELIETTDTPLNDERVHKLLMLLFHPLTIEERAEIIYDQQRKDNNLSTPTWNNLDGKNPFYKSLKDTAIELAKTTEDGSVGEYLKQVEAERLKKAEGKKPPTKASKPNARVRPSRAKTPKKT